MGVVDEEYFLCVAMPTSMALYKWSCELQSFIFIKVSQHSRSSSNTFQAGQSDLFKDPCTCLKFMPALGKFMWASSHFYTLDPVTQNVEKFAGSITAATDCPAGCFQVQFLWKSSQKSRIDIVNRLDRVIFCFALLHTRFMLPLTSSKSLFTKISPAHVAQQT